LSLVAGLADAKLAHERGLSKVGVLPRRLAEGLRRALRVEDVVGDLEGEAEVLGVGDQGLPLARGEALQRRQAFRPETTVDEYLARCSLKTGKLFEAACLLGGGRPGLGEFGLALGIAFQIADDILDCAGQTQDTGKIPGTDLREGTPTMPLRLAAQQDELVRAALAGGPLDGALVRVAATDALARSRQAALDYAATARSFLGSEPHREELEALTHAVVDRAS